MSLDISYSGGVFSAPQAKSVGTVTAGTGPYNLAVASYDSVSFSVASQETSAQEIFFKDDGTKVYVIGVTNDKIYQYSLSTAWDISTASYDSVSFGTATQENTPTGLFFKPDGSKFYLLGFFAKTVFQYSMSTPWDVSTASYDSVSFSVNTEESNPRDVSFKPDGTKMYITGIAADEVNEYSLSTAWDVSTASYAANFNVATEELNPNSLSFNPDGDKFWMVGLTSDSVFQYSLSTAWDISTASYDSISFSVVSQASSSSSIRFKSDGTKMYILDQGGTIYQYSTGTATTLDLSTGNYFSYTPTANTTFAFSNAPASGTAAGFALALTGANAGETYDIANASYDNKSFAVGSDSSIPLGLNASYDGTKFYIADNGGDDIDQYDLSTAWDISTASYNNKRLSVSSQDTTPLTVALNSDGTKMFLLGAANNSIYQYSLSTAWDISTGSYDSVTFSLTTQSTGVSSFFVVSDGTKLFVSTHSSGVAVVYQYSLSTAWDLSTISYDSKSFSVYSQESTPRGISLNSDGTKLFILGNINDTVYQYSLSTAYDISTASYDSVSFSVSSQADNQYGILFKPDGTKMYTVAITNDRIYQYSTGSTATATFTYPSSVKFPNGTAPAGPAIGETDVLVFYTDDGGTTYQGFKAGDAMA
jgi:sugar lactone lactonase YvrE